VSICKDAVKNRYEKIIIFEDDISITKNFTKINLLTIENFLKTKKWNLFFLGCFPDNRYITRKIQRGVYMTKAYGAHAYALNKSYIEKIASLSWEGRSYDGYLKDDYQYAFLPRLFDQKAEASDIPRGVNFVNRYPILKKVVLDANEWYAVNSFYVLVGIVLWILGLVFLYRQRRIELAYSKK
jgi:GR25 family glycosyltransferase involved in LPS biosynthesis